MAILFEDKVSKEFVNKIKEISFSLGISTNWLMFVINYETAGTFSPSKKNPTSTATGLIQFLESTAKDLGTTTAQLSSMTAVEQLDWVYKYLKPRKGKMVDYYTTYLAVFYPVAISKEDTYVFPSSPVRSNPSFFKTGSTKADFKKGLDAIVYAQVSTDYYDDFFKKKVLFCASIREKLFSEEQFCYS